MKKFILYIIILLLLPGNVYLAFLHREKPQVQLNLLNTINSQYCADVDKKDTPDSFTWHAPTGHIIQFIRTDSIKFSLGCIRNLSNFNWIEHEGAYILIYADVFCVDFNKDFVFDVFRKNEKYFIVTDRNRIEVDKPDFKAMQAVTPDKQKYHWNGNVWIKR